MENKRLSLQEIKQIELELLKEYKKFCEKNQFHYTLCGGTLLGAVRHKGFIPWDDDIDVFLTRSDYNKVLEGQADLSTLPDYMKFISFKDGSSPFPFIKLVDTRTKIKVDYFDEKKNVTNIWIDVFPVDPIPSDDQKVRDIMSRSAKYRQLLTLKLAKAGEGKTLFKRAVKPILKLFVAPLSIENLCNKIDTLTEPYWNQDTEEVACCVWGYGYCERMSRAGYETYVPIEFEGETMRAPSNWDTYLSNLYGDYMQLPPEEKRVQHGIEAYLMEK